MIFEPCGDLLLEPNNILEAKSTQNLSHGQNSNLRSTILELNQEEERLQFGTNIFEHIEDQIVPEGFWQNEEEWSALEQHNLGLQPYEYDKMSSLPKSFTPFSLTTVGLEPHLNSNGSSADSIWLRKCESLNSTPSQYFFNGNEPNNNGGIHPLPLSKLILFNPKGTDIFQEEDEKENWSGDSWMKGSADHHNSTSISLNNTINNNSSPTRCSYFWNNVCNSLSDQEISQKEGDYDNILSGVAFSAIGSTPTVPSLLSSPNNQNISTSPIENDKTSSSTTENVSTDTSGAKRPFPVGSLSDSDYKSSFCQYQEWKSNLSQWDDENQGCNDHGSNRGQNVKLKCRPSVKEPLYVNVSYKEHLTNDSGTLNDAKIEEKDCNDSAEDERRPKEEMDTLLTFLSKFDEKVAAIWGQECEGNQFSGLSSQNTPAISVGGSSNPWGSPTNNLHSPSSDDSHHQPSLFDFRAMQLQLQYQQQPTSEMSRNEDVFRHGKRLPSINRSNRLAIGGNRSSPPKGKHTIMHSMREYFGTAPPENEYHIVRQVECPESEEEMQKSLSILNHSGSSSSFVNFVPDIAWANDPGDQDSNDSFGYGDCNGDPLNEYDLDGEDELEIVVACSKHKGKPLIQVPLEDLLHSWKTHFRTVGALEAKGYTEYALKEDNSNQSPINSCGLSAHQINPHLPHFRTFNGDDEEYSLLSKRACDNSYFPVRFKIRRENEKGSQTMDADEFRDFRFQPHDNLLGGFDWEGYLPSQPLFPQSLVGQDQHSPLDPSTIFDYDNALQIRSSNWHTGEKAVGGEMDLDYMDNQSEYYDDMFADYEGDYEFLVGGCSSSVGPSQNGISTYNPLSTSNENDTDFGHFQGFGFQSSGSGKQSKANRRRARIRPCKYYFLEGSCRRGNDCKFSHDLITITCRYWAEGSCLKGSSCPFLHCFLDSKDLAVQDEFGASTLAQDKKYQLESESDFPALGSTNANAMISSQVPMSMGFPTSSGEGDSMGLLEPCADESYENLMIFLTTPPVTSAEDDVNRHKNGLFLFERMSSPLETDSVVGTSFSDPLLSQKTPMMNAHANSSKCQYRSDPQDAHNGRGKSEGPEEGSVRSSAVISKSNSHNSNNWICSMISVKEKRKKKKH